MTPVAEAEVRSSGRYWVRDGKLANAPLNQKDCSSIDRNGRVSKTGCSNLYPIICSNSAPRRTTSKTNFEGDTSRQIKVPTKSLGTLQGHRDSTTFRFYGIPYAQPPVGSRRFAAPKPLRNQDSGTLVDANKFGHVCTQLPPKNFTFDDVLLGAQQSEDCLYLNVFTPTLKSKGNKGIPVMNQPAISKSSAPGNLPTRDQIAALQWVKKNIATFGGDPSQVTIFGESAGGWSMRALLSAPSAFGLYKNVISQSDPIGLPFSGPDFAADISNRTLENLGCASANLTCAQNKTTDQVRDAQVKAMEDVRRLPGNQWILGAGIYRPCIDGDLIPANFDELVQQGKHNTRANILWGTTKDEHATFIQGYLPNPVPVNANMTQTYIALDGDTARYEKLMTSPYYQYNSTVNDTALSRDAAQHGKVYTYRFNHGRSFSDTLGMNSSSSGSNFCTGKVCHGDDIAPTFGSSDVFAGVAQTGNDARFARQIIDRVATFARTGDPNPRKGSTVGAAASNADVTGSPWRAYRSGSNDVMELKLDSVMSKNADKARCRWVEKNIKYDYELYGPGKEDEASA
ncbi:hypothetical protein BGZ93_010501 [Podila epicladia]|nr:hypothetical protein BGZ93_010501 [Podila epicladia]